MQKVTGQIAACLLMLMILLLVAFEDLTAAEAVRLVMHSAVAKGEVLDAVEK